MHGYMWLGICTLPCILVSCLGGSQQVLTTENGNNKTLYQNFISKVNRGGFGSWMHRVMIKGRLRETENLTHPSMLYEMHMAVVYNSVKSDSEPIPVEPGDRVSRTDRKVSPSTNGYMQQRTEIASKTFQANQT